MAPAANPANGELEIFIHVFRNSQINNHIYLQLKCLWPLKMESATLEWAHGME